MTRVTEEIGQSDRNLAFSPPCDWDVKPLGYLFESVGGATPSKNNPEYWDGRIPWVSPKDMKSEVIEDSEDHISDSALAESRLSLLPAGTVLIVVRGMILVRTIPVAITAVEATINQDMKGLFPRRGVIPEYLALVLRSISPILFSTIEESGHGTRCLRLDLWRNILVGIPSQQVQRQIVDFVGERSAQIDDLIAKKERMIDLLQEKRQALISEAVTTGLDPDVPMKDSGIEWLESIPAHWTVRRAKYLFSQSNLPPRDDDEIVTCYRDGQVTLRRNRRSEGYTIAILEGGYQGVRVGQLVVHSMDAFAGAIGVSDSNGKCTPEYIVCNPASPEVVTDYYAPLLREMARRRFIQVSCLAVRERAPRIRFSSLAEMLLPSPPRVEQSRIVTYIDDHLRQINPLRHSLLRQVELLREYRQTLISAAVTGKIPVPTEAVS